MDALYSCLRSFHCQDKPECEFWNRLDFNLRDLGKVLGMPFSDTILLVHFIIKQIHGHEYKPSEGSINEEASLLQTAEARDEWEVMFSEKFFLPTIQNRHWCVSSAKKQLSEDKAQMCPPLEDLVYERTAPSQRFTSSLWSFHPRQSLEDLNQSLQAEDYSLQCSILHTFLKLEPSLRATQYLPKILQLQRVVCNSLRHIKSAEEVAKDTIGSFCSSFSSGRGLRELLKALRKAWELVRGNVQVSGDNAHTMFSDEESLEVIVPRPEGLGKCTNSLVKYLINVHNEFIETCMTTVKQSRWKEKEVMLAKLRPLHVLQYSLNQLMTIVSAHCHYTLRPGQGKTETVYDFHALQRHLLNELVYGKPLIRVKKLLQMVYRKDVYTAEKFDEINSKVHPQIPLTGDAQKRILGHVKEIHQLRAALDHVEIVMGFLAASSQLNPKRSLRVYATNTLRIEGFDRVIGGECTLGHILSLWETISVELARQLTDSGQDPFQGVKDCFRRPLGDKSDRLTQALKSMNLIFLLRLLNKFIEIYIRNASAKESERRLLDCLKEFSKEDTKYLEERRFPRRILTGQVIEVWKKLVEQASSSQE